jgi:hypothetical protein
LFLIFFIFLIELSILFFFL